ncbi:MAG: Imm1 family immunity protein [Planctomycetota bacterium]
MAHSVAEVFDVLDDEERKATVPTIARIEYPHESRVDFGFGDEGYLLIVWPRWRDSPPGVWYTALGDAAPGPPVDFWLQGLDHSSFDRRYLLTKAVAREALYAFLETGERLASVPWDFQEF